MLKSNGKQSHSPKIGNIVQYSLTKWLTQGLWECLLIFYYFYIYIFYFVSQVLCICTNLPYTSFSMRHIFYFLFTIILFFFYLIIWWGIGFASESKLEVLKNGWFWDHFCFYYFLLFSLIILFYYHSDIPYIRV
jgi:hypothetical protein